MAADLRVLVAILFIANELERMADHAEGIGRINLMLGDEPLPRPLGEISEMAEKARRHAAPQPDGVRRARRRSRPPHLRRGR